MAVPDILQSNANLSFVFSEIIENRKQIDIFITYFENMYIRS